MRKTLDKRLDALIVLADKTGHTLDDLVHWVGLLDQKAFDAVCETPSVLPRYMASSVKP